MKFVCYVTTTMILYVCKNIGCYQMNCTFCRLFILSLLLLAGLSAVNISKVLLVGRPYGCTAILYMQLFINSIKVIDSKDNRITGIIVQSRYGPRLILCVCLPTNSGDDECLENCFDTVLGFMPSILTQMQ